MSTASPSRKILPILLWTAIGAAAVFALFTLALARGESVNALWLVTAAVCVYLIGYRFYALFIATNMCCSAIISRPSPAPARWSARCSPRKWVISLARCG